MIPAIIYLVSGLALAHGSPGSRSAPWSPSPRMLNRLVAPATALQGIGIAASTSMALFGRIFDVLDLPVDVAEKPNARSLPRPARRSTDRQASFRYSDDAPWTLSDIDFVVEPGTTTALVGETGSGKTTLAYLVARLYDPQRGQVMIDGVDLRDLKFSAISDARRPGVAGDLPLPRVRSGESALRRTGSYRCRGDRRSPGRADPRVDRRLARGVRHGASALGAIGSPVASGSGSRSPGCCCAIRRS